LVIGNFDGNINDDKLELREKEIIDISTLSNFNI